MATVTQEQIDEFQDRFKRQGRIVHVLNFPQETLVELSSTFSSSELREIADFLDGTED
jgi:hypothetical protein